MKGLVVFLILLVIALGYDLQKQAAITHRNQARIERTLRATTITNLEVRDRLAQASH